MPIDDFFKWNDQQEREALAQASRMMPNDTILKTLAGRQATPRPISEAMAYVHEQWHKEPVDPEWGKIWHVLLKAVTG